MSGAAAVVQRRAFVLAGACFAVLVAVYLLAVWTPGGQRFEDAVLGAADRVVSGAEETRALNTLDSITAPSVVAAAILVLLIAFLQRRFFLGLLSVGMISASIATVEAIQHFTRRPILLAHGYRREDQSFPSGHAAVAMALMVALVMVVPYRFRGLAVVLGSLWVAGVGVATVTASWHRPSDTIGSGLIVVGYACVAVAVLARWGRVREATAATSVGRLLRGLLAAGYAVVAVLAFGVAAAMVAAVLTGPDRHDPTTILAAGRAFALSASTAVAAALLGLLRRVDLGAPRAVPTGEGSPDGELRNAGVDRSTGIQRR